VTILPLTPLKLDVPPWPDSRISQTSYSFGPRITRDQEKIKRILQILKIALIIPAINKNIFIYAL
jgi:hypothetical protein